MLMVDLIIKRDRLILYLFSTYLFYDYVKNECFVVFISFLNSGSLPYIIIPKLFLI